LGEELRFEETMASKASDWSEMRVEYREWLIETGGVTEKMVVMVQKHKEILDHLERKATLAIGNAGGLSGESMSDFPRRGPVWFVAYNLAAAVVAESQSAQSGPDKTVGGGSEREGNMHARHREADRLILGKYHCVRMCCPLVQMPAGAESRTGHRGLASNQPCPMKKHYHALSAG
jgi:hypothetical protein